MGDTQGAEKKEAGFHFHSWRTVRDDGYWYYQACQRCELRRVKPKESTYAVRQPANPLWMKGEQFPTPVGEEK